MTDTVPPKRRTKPDYLKGGSRKGIPNKATASIKQAFVAAFDELGGAPALAKWGRENPTDFYKLASKLIPTEVHANVTHRDLRADEIEDDELARIATGSGGRTSAPASGAGGPAGVH